MPQALTEKKQNVKLSIEGMTCTNCALGVTKFLEKKGVENIAVDFTSNEARFTLGQDDLLPDIKKGIERLGYRVVDEKSTGSRIGQFSITQKFYFCLAFSAPLLLHMFTDAALLNNPWFQLALCLPVYVVGLLHFGRSALGSLNAGVPNMDVLILMGASAAFGYSLYGAVNGLGHDFLFFETAATIITVVLLGNLLEQKSVRQTTSAIRELSRLHAQKAKLIFSLQNGKEHVTEVETDFVKKGHIALVNTGDLVPADGIVMWGECSVDESMISGESRPAEKSPGDPVIGGTALLKGSIKMEVTASGSDTVLSGIIELVKSAQQNKPDIQRLADKVSAWFVPAVTVAAALTFIISAFPLDVPVKDALMRSVAVLVIACPCAMGLATPTAVMVGIGIITKRGVLVKGGKTLETLSGIRQIVFDKTGTLTTGRFKINKMTASGISEADLKSVLFSIEQHSSHPIARSVAAELKGAPEIPFKKITEMKGAGMRAEDEKGNVVEIGSYQLARSQTVDSNHDIYVLLNKKLIGWVDIEDELKPEAASTIEFLKSQQITPVMMSGDSYRKCAAAAARLGIEKFYFGKLPHEKMELIVQLSKKSPTAMVGDGVNDAPALAKADIGISLSDATQAAIDSAQVILLNGNLAHLRTALVLSRKTMTTIRQNLFWAFFYNTLAIPVAAAGFLNPMIAAFSMALSDVFVVGNSLRLKVRKH